MGDNKHTCKYCGSKFSTKQSFNLHTKTSKYCLDKRKLYVGFTCNGCQSKYSTIGSLKRHMKSGACERKRNQEMVMITKEDYQELLKLKNSKTNTGNNNNANVNTGDYNTINNSPTTDNSTTNNDNSTTNNIHIHLQLTPQYLEETAKLLTLKDLLERGIMLGKFFKEKQIKDR